MEELKPCPFCGGDAMVSNVTRKYLLGGETEDRFAISCISCGANGGDKKTKEECIEIWNRRTDK